MPPHTVPCRLLSVTQHMQDKTAAVIVYNVLYLISDKFDSIFTVLRNNSQWLGCHRYVQYTFRILPRLNEYMTMTFLHLSLHFTIHFHADTAVAYFFAHIIFTTNILTQLPQFFYTVYTSRFRL